jgi:glycosyltransferase involved in cell wall biosynthesis
MEAFPDRGSGSPLMVLKLHGTSHRSADLARLLAEISGHPLFQIIDESLTDDDILHLQSACDCFVSLHRSEGFGLNIAECMAAGRLAIATDFSGNRDFMHPANSILIPYGMREVARGDYVAGVGQWWAEPDHAASVRAMRWAFEHQDEARALGARAQDDIAAGFSFEHVGALAAAALARPFTKRALPSIPLLSHGSVAPRIGRNDPCPCGSGRKFKLCHGRTTNEKKR